jgi:hypothetical protein
VVRVLALGRNVRGFKPSRGRWNVKAIIPRRAISLGGEAKPSVPCRKTSPPVTNPTNMTEIHRRKNSGPSVAKFLLLRY